MAFVELVQDLYYPKSLCLSSREHLMYDAYYSQVFSIGLIWVFFHCGGMCGPIIAGVTSSVPVRGSRGSQLRTRALRVLAYQAGRALTYLALGATAGFLGLAFEKSIRGFTQVAGLILAFVLILVGAGKLGLLGARVSKKASELSQRVGQKLGGLLRVLGREGPSSGLSRFVFTGVLMGFLPCMLMFWVLSIATSTASPIHGAGVMLLLVAMTTPTLLIAGCAAGLKKFRRAELVAPIAMIVSGVWLFLIAAAANGWIEHIHIQFELLGEGYVLMLW